MPNANPTTGIPYGTIYLHHLDPDLAQDLYFNYGEDISYKEAVEEMRAQIAREMRDEEENGECPTRSLDDFNDELDERVEARIEGIYINEPTIEGEYEGVKYMISWLGGAPLLWVFYSPYTGSYARCSPCVPGAGDLETPDEFGIQCYDVPPDWRRKD